MVHINSVLSNSIMTISSYAITHVLFPTFQLQTHHYHIKEVKVSVLLVTHIYVICV